MTLTSLQGKVVGGTYQLVARIGSGGTSEVYSAEHVRLGRMCAVKVLRASSVHARERFKREARALSRITNEFVVGIIDCGETDGETPYFVMDLLEGESLRSLLKQSKSLPIWRAAAIVRDASLGAFAIHRAGLVHRDLKPENLQVVRTPTGEERCKVLDFGSAKTDVSGLTATGALIGTVRYMAPEQLCDASAASPLADIYALGSVLYECLCGEPPHSNVSLPDLMFAIMNEEPLRLETRCEAVPRMLVDAVHCALSKSPQGRFSDASLLARALDPYAGLAKSTAEP